MSKVGDAQYVMYVSKKKGSNDTKTTTRIWYIGRNEADGQVRKKAKKARVVFQEY